MRAHTQTHRKAPTGSAGGAPTTTNAVVPRVGHALEELEKAIELLGETVEAARASFRMVCTEIPPPPLPDRPSSEEESPVLVLVLRSYTVRLQAATESLRRLMQGCELPTLTR